MNRVPGRAAVERVEFIQALRGIAALAVVMFHGRDLIAGAAFLDAGERLFKNGAAGCDLFFVVSGFIMVHTTWDSPGGPRIAARFFARRFARIWPVYVIATFAYLAAHGTLVAWLTSWTSILRLAKAFVFYPSHRQAPPYFGWTPNSVGWTLNYEVWFYLLFAISLLAGRRRLVTLASLFALFLVAVPFAITGHVDASADHDYAMSPVILDLGACSMAWEFLAGAAIGAIYRSEVRLGNRELLGTFAILSVTAVVWQQLSDQWSCHGMTGWGPAMIVMVLALALWNKERPITAPRSLVWLGDISFSLYLVHRIPQNALPRLVPETHRALANGVGALVATTVIALVLAHYSHRYLERGVSERFQRWLLRRIPPSPPVQ